MFRLKSLATVVATTVACVLGLAAPAGAQPVPVKIVGTGGTGVNMRSGPSTSYPVVGRVAEGVSPDFICYDLDGERIGGGPGVGTTLWWRVSYNGVTGYYSSAYDTVPYEWQTDNGLLSHYGVGRCGYQASPPSETGTSGYDRQAAVRWALTHVQDPEPHFNGCAWFVSQTLWAGGLPKTKAWTDQGSHGLNPIVPGTHSATVAQHLYGYLTYFESMEVVPLADRFAPGNNAVPEARVGDLIFYDEDGDQDMEHASVVVHISPGDYPDVAEWGTVGPDQRVSYRWRGWTWSEKNHHWWKEGKSAGATAYLVRVN